MDLYVVDDNYQRIVPVDEFVSVIWTERYSESGEVNLVLAANTSLRSVLIEDALLMTPGSQDVMMIDTASVKNNILTVIGYSITDFFKQRFLRDKWQTATDSWKLGPAPAGSIANTIVQKMCMAGGYLTDGTVLTLAQGANEVIPKLSLATPPTGPDITVPVQYGNVYDGIKTACDLDELGFRLYPPNPMDGTGNLQFMTYRGRDLTSGQTLYPPVIFEPSLDSFTDVEELRSKSGYKNAVWVWPSGATSQAQVVVAYAPGASTLTGFKRRSMMLEATDVQVADYTAPELSAALLQKGKDALANNNYVRMLDGQLVPQDEYTYGLQYKLGDIVELRGEGALAQKARITEYIRAQDSTGERAYPTLSVID